MDSIHWRAPELGTRLEAALPQGLVRHHRIGRGPAVLFSHGWLANANLWRKVIARLAPKDPAERLADLIAVAAIAAQV